ncbi:YggU family protein [Candidatus Woesearchaeota archaeon]|nr:YggU family protein [Candidatus Woesearchaeota archaeon]
MDLEKYIKNNQLVILVKPNSPKNEILGHDKEKDALKVNIKASPEDNKANKEIIKFFRKILKKEIKIAKGLKTKKKILKIGWN